MENSFIILIGGREKKGGYEELFSSLKESNLLKEIIVYGESCEKLYEIAKECGIKNINVAHNFNNAVNFAFSLSGAECVLLSPACSSYDEFTCFEERGDKFIELVNGFIGKQGESK